MADDAGALLVRSGLVSSSALDAARARVAAAGGTLGEQLVVAGAISDDALTEFYRQRLLVPQVNPNTLARLAPKVVAAIPGDMAIELRAIPVSLDGDNNLTVAMSDPSDRHAVDEISFFTRAYVVRAVATQMQIAWCLAHYYGHVTALGARLIQPARPGAVGAGAAVGGGIVAAVTGAAAPPRPAIVAAPAVVAATAPSAGGPAGSQRFPRMKGLTGKVEAARHRAVAPVTGPIDIARPLSGELDRAGAEARAAAAGPAPAIDADADADAEADGDGERDGAGATPRPAARERPLRASSPPVVPIARDGAPDAPRARSISGEIRVPLRVRAASIRPPMPDPHGADGEEEDDDEPLISVEEGTDGSGPRMVPVRRRVKSDPPELAARAGEVALAAREDRPVVDDEPRIIIDDDALVPVAPVAGELRGAPAARGPDAAVPDATIEVDESTGAVIQAHADAPSEPVLLERRRSVERPAAPAPVAPAPEITIEPAAGGDDEDDEDDENDENDDDGEVVVLERKKAPTPRPEKRTQMGIGVPAPAVYARVHRDTEASAAPTEIEDGPTAAETAPLHAAAAAADHEADDDAPTRVDGRAAPPRSRHDTEDPLAAPPPHRGGAPRAADGAGAAGPRDAGDDDDDDDGDDLRPVPAVPGGDRRRVDYDPVDDGWGPPGTTIPPPLLGALPGSDEDEELGPGPGAAIPVPNVNAAPLIVAPPSPPEPARGSPALPTPSGPSLVRALEEATSRAVELIRALERAKDRDTVVTLMIGHLGESHMRAGFFSIRPGHDARKAGELAVFKIQPAPATPPLATLRLDGASTLQDVVGTRLPYRGPMHDDASRNFLASVLGACPPEILLVPVTVRDRVVGVLFGEHRLRHTFDDQLALAARAAGMALERILLAKRG